MYEPIQGILPLFLPATFDKKWKTFVIVIIAPIFSFFSFPSTSINCIFSGLAFLAQDRVSGIPVGS